MIRNEKKGRFSRGISSAGARDDGVRFVWSSTASVVDTGVGGGGGHIEADTEAPIIGDEGSEELLHLRIISHESRARSSLFARSVRDEQGRVSDKSIFGNAGSP